ncbi:tRNA-U20-dihydrouridine synthase [Myxococcus fulvus]|uniref:tRNA-dihydrouridine synthase n=1 Tax=Myxococcus fulvus TaxID=33 RepID=A0A511SZN4_MYXFU|nr:tRNA dihydrouridine synthase DusB [Myxococcus fulvus]GEN07370.1 tRNA-dihydrouridine synthase [Myxococcus fulvus]SET94854.1 tRNA-U20-dihydrouridine synthase [Myxococcus fulvus]
MLRLGPFTLANPYVLAPMAGVSEMPYRVLAFRMGAALCPTELVSSQGLMRANQRTLMYLRFDAQVEKPYSLQLYGGDPEAMGLAASVGKSHGAQLLDINMGCPVKKVTKNGAGSALLSDPPRAAAIVRAMREASGLPVTCKIRSGWDARSRNYLQMAEALQEAGCAGLAIHPRTREQGYSGSADWSVIADVKRHFPELPLFGNGDVKSCEDARRMLETTGCDFVMIGRAALGNPWIFRELNGGEPPTPEERCALVLEHFHSHLAFVGDPLGAVRSFRRHLGWYAHGLVGAAVFRARANTLDAPEAVADAVRAFFATADRASHSGAASEEEQDVDYRAALG